MKVALVGPYPEPGQGISGGVERVIERVGGRVLLRGR